MPTVHVTLVDAATHQVFGEADLSVEQLPESFAAHTVMSLGAAEWQVEHAAPVTRAEFAASGQLRLVLRKVERVDPEEILFSLPTIENALPDRVPGDASDALVLHEDDWRQHELVASRFEPEIAAELADIREARDSAKGVGFQNLHVRSRIPAPLAGVALPFADVARLAGVEHVPVALGGQPGVVDGGFAFVTEGFAIYGRERDGLVGVLAIDRGEPPLGALAKQYGLVVVNWIRAQTG